MWWPSGVVAFWCGAFWCGGLMVQYLLMWWPSGPPEDHTRRPPSIRRPPNQKVITEGHIAPGAEPPKEQTPQEQTPRSRTPQETCCKACSDTTCNSCWDSTPSPLWTEWQTGVKILPCPKLRLRAVIIGLHLFPHFGLAHPTPYGKFWIRHCKKRTWMTVSNKSNYWFPTGPSSRSMYTHPEISE